MESTVNLSARNSPVTAAAPNVRVSQRHSRLALDSLDYLHPFLMFWSAVRQKTVVVLWCTSVLLGSS